MKLKNDQTGLALIYGVFLLAFFLLVGITGFRTFRSHKAVNSPPDSVSNLTTEPSVTPDNKTSGKIVGQVFCTSLDSQQPCATTIEYESTATNPASGRYTQPLVVDASGQFSVDLAPGSYTFTPAHKPDFPYFLPALKNPVEVKTGQTTNITINYHDGTR